MYLFILWKQHASVKDLICTGAQSHQDKPMEDVNCNEFSLIMDLQIGPWGKLLLSPFSLWQGYILQWSSLII